jgi:hypothetical protein
VDADYTEVAVDTTTVVASGPGNSWSTINNAGAGWVVNQWRGFSLFNVTKNEHLTIASNTATNLVLVGSITATDDCHIVDKNSYNGILEPSGTNDLVIRSNILIKFRFVKFHWQSAVNTEKMLRQVGLTPYLCSCYFDFSGGANAEGRLMSTFNLQGCGSDSRISDINLSHPQKLMYKNCYFGGDDSRQDMHDRSSMEDCYIFQADLFTYFMPKISYIRRCHFDNTGVDIRNVTNIISPYPINIIFDTCIFINDEADSITLSRDAKATFINCTITTDRTAITSGDNCDIVIMSDNTLTCLSTCIFIRGSKLTTTDDGNLIMTSSSGRCIRMENSDWNINSITCSLTSVSEGIFMEAGSRIRGGTNYQLDFTTPDVAIKLTDNSSCSLGSPNLSIAGGGDAIECGALAPTATFVSQDDYSEVGTKYCIFQV